MNASYGTNSYENNPNSFRSNDQQRRKGRQKLRMEKIEDERRLQVTFSKRRAGIFKKANELNTLCDAESAILVFSPCEMAHTYAHPDMETIENRFLNANVGPTRPANPLLAALQKASNQQLNQEVIHMEGLLEHEMQRKTELNHTFQLRIDGMNYEELNRLHESLLRYKCIFQSRLKDATNSGGEENPNPNPNVGFTNPGGYNMIGDPTHWAGDSSAPMGFLHGNGSGGSTNVRGPNPKQGGLDPSVGSTYRSGINMSGHPNCEGSSSSSCPAPFNPNMGYVVQSFDASGAGGSMS